MVRNTEHILGSYLISRSILFLSLSMVLFAQDSTKLVVEKDSTFYPGKPLLLSLVAPGLGQVYNKEPL